MNRLRGMPWGVALFLAYAGVILVIIGLSLKPVIDLAIDAPVSPVGLVVMSLLAYTIFTVTLTLQRKTAARAMALGLSSLAVPPIALAVLAEQPIVALFFVALAALLFRGLRTAGTRAWLNEP
jgi:hypothetical protein